jgi:hypothetical protein
MQICANLCKFAQAVQNRFPNPFQPARRSPRIFGLHPKASIRNYPKVAAITRNQVQLPETDFDGEEGDNLVEIFGVASKGFI